MSKVEFVCEREPLIAEYCQRKFGGEFAQMFKRHGKNHRELLDKKFVFLLAEEARLQEWYEYTEVPIEADLFGLCAVRRQPIRDEDGKPVLLVPEVRIVDAKNPGR